MVFLPSELSKMTATYFNNKFKDRTLILSEISPDTGDIVNSVCISITKGQAQDFIDADLFPTVCETAKQLYFTQ
tara:strand:- start:1810 stop:2031 length:222 start_codon:yes stop_codon:yes gene_type:complete